MLPFKKPFLDRELLDWHQVFDPGSLRKRGRQREVGDMSCLLDLVCLQPVEEGPRPVEPLRPHRRQHPVEVPDLGKKFLEMHEHRTPEPAHIPEFPAHLALCALQADPLPAVADTGCLIDRCETVF